MASDELQLVVSFSCARRQGIAMTNAQFRSENSPITPTADRRDAAKIIAICRANGPEQHLRRDQYGCTIERLGGNMDQKKYENYKGFLISGCAEFDSGRWRSMAILQRPNCDSEGIPVSPVCDTAAAAIEQALGAARAMVDSKGFGLKEIEDSAHVMSADEHQEDALDEALIESFPASDPIAVAFPSAPLRR